MLTDKCSREALQKALREIPFRPAPTCSEREKWADVVPETKEKWIRAAEGYLDYDWPPLTMKYYFHFQKTGENIPYLHRFWERRSALGILILAECLEGEGRFLEQIISGIFSICEETVWITAFDLGNTGSRVPAEEDHLVDLSCSETGALLAWADYLLGSELDAFDPRIRRRIRKEVGEHLITPYLAHDDYWWMGFVDTPHINNWNPWCNKNMLFCLLFSCDDPERQAEGVWKAMRSLESYLRHYPADGCCGEGPMYWGAAGGDLCTCLQMLKIATGGQADAFDEEIVVRMGQYFRNVHIDGKYFVDFADGDAIVSAGTSAYQYGKCIGDEALTRLGASAEASGPIITTWFAVYSHLTDILEEKERRAANTGAPYCKQSWMYVAQVMTAREREGSPKGFYLAAKGGNNEEPHNHNDVGNFILYLNGKPLFFDLGTEEYTAKTFSADRFSLWYLQSGYHNCPVVNGIDQHDGKEFAASRAECSLTEDAASLALEISPAYPAKAGLAEWDRSFTLDRKAGTVAILDEWKLGAPGSCAYHFMLACKPEMAGDGRLAFSCGGETAYLDYDPALRCRIEEIPITESRLHWNWGDMVWRVIFEEPEKTASGSRAWTVRHTEGERA